MHSSSNAYNTEKDVKVNVENASISSPTSDYPPPYTMSDQNEAILPSTYRSPLPDLMPNPTKLLTLHAQGTCGSKSHAEWTIPIFSGTDINAEPLYTSNRVKHNSNNAILSHKTRGEIVSTTYRWGWGKKRQPKIRYITQGSRGDTDVKGLPVDASDEEPVELQASTNSWTNETTMTSDNHPDRSLAWRYLKTKTTLEGKLRVLALFDNSASTSSSSREPIAVLIRSKLTRTPGSSRWAAGNGGQLLLSDLTGASIDESLVVASCLMVLKKEIDRTQAALGAAAAS